MVKEEVEITHKVHSMIIGRKGAGIRKIMSDYRVDIKLPKPGDQNPDLVIVSGGDKEKVASCIKHLVCLSEDYMDDADDWMDEYIKNSSRNDGSQKVSHRNEIKNQDSLLMTLFITYRLPRKTNRRDSTLPRVPRGKVPATRPSHPSARAESLPLLPLSGARDVKGLICLQKQS